MYNRYIPQPDGTFQRNRLPDNIPQSSKPGSTPPVPSNPEFPEQRPNIPEISASPPREPAAPPSKPRPVKKSPTPRDHTSGNIVSFFRQLLPKDLNTGDLMVILLLFLMAQDCAEDQNTALLTLALYLFL